MQILTPPEGPFSKTNFTNFKIVKNVHHNQISTSLPTRKSALGTSRNLKKHVGLPQKTCLDFLEKESNFPQ